MRILKVIYWLKYTDDGKIYHIRKGNGLDKLYALKLLVGGRQGESAVWAFGY